MGAITINDVRQGKRDKIIQLLKALRAWEDSEKKRRAPSQTIVLSSSPTNSGNNNPSASLPVSFFWRNRRSPGPSPELDTRANAEFTRQVERLADLLLHADKDVLAGYLSRAGQEMLAIGQYLEDEKNGNVRLH